MTTALATCIAVESVRSRGAGVAVRSDHAAQKRSTERAVIEAHACAVPAAHAGYFFGLSARTTGRAGRDNASRRGGGALNTHNFGGDGATVARQPHKLEKVGSIPTPAPALRVTGIPSSPPPRTRRARSTSLPRGAVTRVRFTSLPGREGQSHKKKGAASFGDPGGAAPAHSEAP